MATDIFAVLTYDTNKAENILDISEVWTPVLTLNTPNRDAGQYNWGVSMTYTFISATKSAFFRWRQDGGAWSEFQSEPKDITDKTAVYYAFPSGYAAGTHVFEAQMRKEDSGSGQLDLLFIDMFFQRIG